MACRLLFYIICYSLLNISLLIQQIYHYYFVKRRYFILFLCLDNKVIALNVFNPKNDSVDK